MNRISLNKSRKKIKLKKIKLKKMNYNKIIDKYNIK